MHALGAPAQAGHREPDPGGAGAAAGPAQQGGARRLGREVHPRADRGGSEGAAGRGHRRGEGPAHDPRAGADRLHGEPDPARDRGAPRLCQGGRCGRHQCGDRRDLAHRYRGRLRRLAAQAQSGAKASPHRGEAARRRASRPQPAGTPGRAHQQRSHRVAGAGGDAGTHRRPGGDRSLRPVTQHQLRDRAVRAAAGRSQGRGAAAALRCATCRRGCAWWKSATPR